MAKVRCRDCEYNYLDNWCRYEGRYDNSCGSTYTSNKEGDCKKYKRKWWKFWVCKLNIRL